MSTKATISIDAEIQKVFKAVCSMRDLDQRQGAHQAINAWMGPQADLVREQMKQSNPARSKRSSKIPATA